MRDTFDPFALTSTSRLTLCDFESGFRREQSAVERGMEGVGEASEGEMDHSPTRHEVTNYCGDEAFVK